MISPTLNVPQARFLSMPHKFKAYIAGFGSGKTWVGCGGICKGIWEHPGINQGYFAPTYPQIRDIFYPTVEEVCCGQLKLATALEFFQYRFSDSFGGNPPLYSCGLSAL